MTLTMSMIFRSIAALSRQFVQAMTPAAVIMVGLVVYTGFAIPVKKMRGWARWINYIDPIAYGFESLVVNEFSGRDFECSQFVPAGPGYPNGGDATVCGVVGAVAGQSSVDGNTFINLSYSYYHSHKWRNVGILFIFMIAFFGVYLFATGQSPSGQQCVADAAEYISAQKSKGEVLVYPRGQAPESRKGRKAQASDAESLGRSSSQPQSDSDGAGGASKVDDSIIQKQTAVFSWKDVVYDIKIKKEPRRILDHVDGWVKPGTLTALMVSQPPASPAEECI